MLPESVAAVLRKIVVATSAGDYDDALSYTRSSRCSAEALQSTIQAYGRKMVAPPFAEWDIVALAVSDSVGWSVRAPLCSEEEGRSDLEMRFTAYLVGDAPVVELDDLLVP